MGYSVSGATVLLLLALLISTVLFAPDAKNAVEEIGDAINGEQQLIRQADSTEFNITSISYNQGKDELEVVITNTGAESLPLDEIDVLADGEHVTPNSTTVEGDSTRDFLEPGDEATLVFGNVAPEPNRVVVNGPLGVSKTGSP